MRRKTPDMQDAEPNLPACPCPRCDHGGSGPDAAFAALVETHLPHCRAVARRLLGCDHLAADAVQETLLALWRTPERPVDLRGWLVRAVVFRSRHLRRTLRRRQRHEQHAASAACILHEGCDNPLHTAWAHELQAHVDAALAALPQEQRHVFQLFEQQGHDYARIAAVTGTPLGTVRSRLARARQALQTSLRESLPGLAED